MKYQIIQGTAAECEKVLNELTKSFYLIVDGISTTSETVTILVNLTSNE